MVFPPPPATGEHCWWMEAEDPQQGGQTSALKRWARLFLLELSKTAHL